MRMSELQRRVLRVTAVVLLVAAGPLLVAGLLDPWQVDPPSETARPFPPGRPVTLPDPGLFGATAALYGAAGGTAGTPGAQDLGCRMLDAAGGETNRAKLSELAALTDLQPITVDGRELRPLLSVRGYGRGWTLRCDGPAAAEAGPLYLAEAAGGVYRPRVLALLTVPLLVAVGLIGLLLTRRPDRVRTARPGP